MKKRDITTSCPTIFEFFFAENCATPVTLIVRDSCQQNPVPRHTGPLAIGARRPHNVSGAHYKPTRRRRRWQLSQVPDSYFGKFVQFAADRSPDYRSELGGCLTSKLVQCRLVCISLFVSFSSLTPCVPRCHRLK